LPESLRNNNVANVEQETSMRAQQLSTAIRAASFIAAIAAAMVHFPAAAAARAERAAPEALVEAVQMPAWVERGGVNIPLAPGMELHSQDRVRTGPDARILLRTAEGSFVKLGEKGSLLLENVRMQRQENVFEATMKVFEGAFRFTTNTLVKFRGRRYVQLTIAGVTAGIRGTDVWGKAAPDRDIVCLIEGKIEVQRGTEASFVMDQPLSFYIAPKNQPALPVAPVDPKQLEQWAAETEVQSGKGAARRDGRWKVVLGSADTQAEALKLYDAVRAAGYAADIRPVDQTGKHVYLVRLSQLPSKAEAQSLADALKGKMGIVEPQVTM
jgi:hypothetical protein